MLKKFLKIFFFAASLFLVACSNILSVPDEPKESSVESTAQNTVSVQTTSVTLSGRIIVNGALPSENPSTQAIRTALPTPLGTDTLTYQVSAQKGSETVTGTVSTEGTDTSYTISFPEPGEWTITAKALSDTQVYLIATATIDTNVTLNKNLILKYPTTSISSDPGSISLPISFADSLGITHISTKLLGVDGGTAVTPVTHLTSVGSFKTFTFSRTSVPAGQYKLTVAFRNSASVTSTPLYYLEQTVNVYPGLQTNKFYGDESYIQDNKIKITDLSSPSLTTFYVHSTSGSDTGSGSYFYPVKTLEQAASLVNSSTASPTAGFQIILQTDTTETSDISITKDVSIISDDLTTKRTVSGGSHSLTSTAPEANFTNISFYEMAGFIVNAGKVTMSNGDFTSCSATNGGAVYVASGAEFDGLNVDFLSCSATDLGGSIYSEGTVDLDTCKIQGCSAKKGGGIYAAGSVNLESCIIGVESPSELPANTSSCISAGGNSATDGPGGGIMLGDYSLLTSTNSKINGNLAKAGGGINVGISSEASNATVKITGGEILYNKATGGNGGGLQIYSKKTYEGGSFVKEVKIKNNHAHGNGGGLSVTSQKYITVENCTDFSGNVATDIGNGCFAAGSLTLAGTTYIADGVYLNTNASPLILNSDFALSGTNTIPLSYNTTSFDASDTAKNTLIKDSTNISLTSEQCDAFTLTDSSGTAITDYIIKYISTSPYKGILAEPSSPAATFNVGSGQTYTTLEAALTAIANSHSTSPADEYQIKVFNDLTLTSDLEISTPGVKITSGNATAPTIQGGGYGIKVNVGAGKEAEVDGVNFSGLTRGIKIVTGTLNINNSTVADGTAKYESDDNNYAAGITVASGASLISSEGLIISGCDNNTDSYNAHSGIYSNGGTVELTGAEITDCDNTKTSGGAIFCKGGGTVTLTDCNIHDNSAQSYGYGGGIYCLGATLELKGTTEIHDNSSWAGNGGGIYVTGSASYTGILRMENSVKIYKNRAGMGGGGNGGGIYIYDGEVLLILNGSSKDTENTASAAGNGQLYYICSNVKILAGSNLNGTEYTSDYVVPTAEAPIKDD